MQSNALFSGSLFEAIAGGQVISLEQAWEAAEQAGLAVGDELLALDGERLRQADSLKGVWSPGQSRELLFCRRGRVRCSSLTAAAPVVGAWSLEQDPGAGTPALERRRQWLNLLPI
jgi:predicted metalloprotease with PDZ domain